MNYRVLSFTNKLKGLIVEDLGSPSVAIMILVRVGARFEQDKVNGIAHFVEHTIFKGTAKRPSSAQIGMEVETLGARMNAFTSQDYTGYYIKAPKEKFSKAIEILADMFHNSLFEAQEIEKERGVILEEKRMYEDQPTDKVVSLFDSKLFKGHELGRDIIGTEKSIGQIKRRDILNFISEHYGGENTIIVVAGAVKQNEIRQEIEKHFSQMLAKKQSSFSKYSKRAVEQEVHHKSKKLNQSHLVLGGFAPSRFDEKRFVFKVANAILGDGFRSRLFQVIRDKLGLAYYVYSSFEQFHEVGALKIGMGVENSKIQEATSAVISELGSIARGDFSEEELVRAQNYLIGLLTTGLETSNDVAIWYGLQLLLNKEILSIDQVKKKILKVKTQDIVDVFGDYINERNLMLAAVTPHKKLAIDLNL